MRSLECSFLWTVLDDLFVRKPVLLRHSIVVFLKEINKLIFIWESSFNKSWFFLESSDPGIFLTDCEWISLKVYQFTSRNSCCYMFRISFLHYLFMSARKFCMIQYHCLLGMSRDVNFFAFFAICAQIAIAIANFHNRSAIAIGFKKNRSRSAIAIDYFSAQFFANCELCAICDLCLFLDCDLRAIRDFLAICHLWLFVDCVLRANRKLRKVTNHKLRAKRKLRTVTNHLLR